MSSKEVDVTCPCCTARLTVDVRTGQVLKRQLPAKEGAQGPAKDAWESAQDRVRERTAEGKRKLDSALDYERTKEARFDELFKKATEKRAPKPDDEG
jgi:hypothetical protein